MKQKLETLGRDVLIDEVRSLREEEVRWTRRIKLLEERAQYAQDVLDGRHDDELGYLFELPRCVHDVVTQVAKIDEKHGRTYASRHEMHSVLREELDELWDEVRKNGSRERVRAELIDVMCVALRALRQLDEERDA